jgi:Flp pilus assembly protein TadG
MLFVITSLAVLFGFCSLAVDLGRAEVAKTELARVAEAAARAAAYQLQIGGSVTAIQNAATAMVAHNPVDGSTLTITPSTDVQLLNWTSSSNYTVVSTTAAANAVRVYARRTTSAGTPITLMFASVLGKSTVDVVASSVAQVYSTSTNVSIPATGNPWLS